MKLGVLILLLAAIPVYGQGKPVLDGCPTTERVELDDNNYAMFCKPAGDNVNVHDYISTVKWNYQATQGRGWIQTGDHWMLEIYVVKFYDGKPPSMDSVRRVKLKDFATMIIETDKDNELTFVGIDIHGRRLYTRYRISSGTLVAITVTTFCGNNACDPDIVGLPRLNSIMEK